jgi:putative photosynthetic complex assembly protein 2
VDYFLPVIFALGAWWLSTIVIIYRAGMPAASFVATLAWTTVFAAFGLWALLSSREDTGAGGAYLAFFGGLSLWAWHEVAYLFGFISGPRPVACPPNKSGWGRFVLGVKTCLYHEIAVLVTVVGLAVLLWNSPNQVGLWTFTILWVMRWSAKLNIFLGVKNLHEEFWPEHLAYLKSFVRRRASNGLLPVSIALSALGVVLLGFSAYGAVDDIAHRTGASLLATLLALALLEHWLLVADIKDDALWKAGLKSRSDHDASA